MADRFNGTVKWFNDEKGFGFIQQEDGSRDLFVHFREVNYKGHGRVSLEENQKVNFSVGKNEKGEFAQDVELV